MWSVNCVSFICKGVIHLVRTHEGGRGGVKQMRMFAYDGREGVEQKRTYVFISQ